MLVRIPGARHSQDVDLLHPGTDIIGAVDELRALCVRPDHFRFTFEIDAKGSLTGVNRGAQLKATVYLGTTRIGNFPIDIAIERTLIGPVERLQPRPAVEIADVSTLPAFIVTPIADQIADKLCAMYELHGPQKVTPSTRFRDLVDLLLIIISCTVDAEHTVSARAQQIRLCPLPTRLPGPARPGPSWAGPGPAAGDRALIEDLLKSELHTLDDALAELSRDDGEPGSDLFGVQPFRPGQATLFERKTRVLHPVISDG
ncbi:hypothetical protein BKP42_52700 [Rhodococcus erythropolis]|nr:hypothetical protein BKP42_52700 [Rhodococcus erythropolis]